MAGPSIGGNPGERRQALRTYELVFIAQPEMEEEDLTALVDSVRQIITDTGGQVVKVEHMGKRRLAYSIKKRQEGHYVLVHAEFERATMLELERRLGLSEDVLRHILVRLDEPVAQASPAPVQEETP